MNILDIKKMAHEILKNQQVENDFIEYKKSLTFKGSILKTACAFANNYMNNEIGLIFIGVEEVDDEKSGIKAIPKIPISGIEKSLLEKTEKEVKSLLSHINVRPKINYQIIADKIDNKHYIVIAIEEYYNGPYTTTEKAEKDENIRLKQGKYIRIERDSRIPTSSEEYELTRKFANLNFSSSWNEKATLDDLNWDYMKNI
ncbi:Divergent AAA domain [Mycoplasmopsis citelli]|uniref:Divergent AAA domain n=3 Tax=Mycoplasmopsis citelli TaxID=171281 RepID=A0A449B2C4_9BACT|nr:Divergent AAA domain [Mycoplasmopsis citelli]